MQKYFKVFHVVNSVTIFYLIVTKSIISMFPVYARLSRATSPSIRQNVVKIGSLEPRQNDFYCICSQIRET